MRDWRKKKTADITYHDKFRVDNNAGDTLLMYISRKRTRVQDRRDQKRKIIRGKNLVRVIQPAYIFFASSLEQIRVSFCRVHKLKIGPVLGQVFIWVMIFLIPLIRAYLCSHIIGNNFLSFFLSAPQTNAMTKGEMFQQPYLVRNPGSVGMLWDSSTRGPRCPSLYVSGFVCDVCT